MLIQDTWRQLRTNSMVHHQQHRSRLVLTRWSSLIRLQNVSLFPWIVSLFLLVFLEAIPLVPWYDSLYWPHKLLNWAQLLSLTYVYLFSMTNQYRIESIIWSSLRHIQCLHFLYYLPHRYHMLEFRNPKFSQSSRLSKVKQTLRLDKKLHEVFRQFFILPVFETFSTSWLLTIYEKVCIDTHTLTERLISIYLQQFENEGKFQKFAWYPGITLLPLGFHQIVGILSSCKFRLVTLCAKQF